VAKTSVARGRPAVLALIATFLVTLIPALPVAADTSAQTLPFSQNWTNIGLITTDNNWDGVPGIIGYRGDAMVGSTGVDPQTVVADGSSTPVNVIANQTSPNTLTTGGVAEFQITDPVVALQGSGTARAPHIVLSLNTTGASNVTVAYNVRDIDGSADNATQAVALQYRVGATGTYTNLPGGFVADATTGPSVATQVTPVSVTLPPAAENQPIVQVRIITTDAVGSDEWVGIDDIVVTTADQPPAVQSTTPTNGATSVALAANIAVNFSEPVNVAGTWFTISCATSGSHTATVSGGPTSFTLDPDTNFAPNEPCTVTILASQVTDQDASDPPDNMTANYVFGFTTLDVLICGDSATAINAVQGSGLTSPMTGSTVTIEGVVVGDYQATGQFSGFYLQEENSDADADPATSEGIFVFGSSLADVSVGDVVRAKGTVTEFVSGTSSLTELTSVSPLAVCSSGASVTPTTVSLPVPTMADFERYEGMLVQFPQTLTATETFTLGRFGEVRLAADGRLFNPTAITTPGAAAIAQEDLNNRRSFVLDDGDNRQNIDPTINPPGGLSASNTLRSGYTTASLTGVFDERFSTYRLQPIGTVPFAATNPRTAAPTALGGNLKVSSFNVLNYFNGDGVGGGFPTSRGATTAFEFQRQREKIINALKIINADIVGLSEIENDAPGNSAIEDLVRGLNFATAPGTYAFINTGVVGTDEIRVAFIYKPGSVTPVGAYKILNSSVDPQFIDTRSRPALAQTFDRNADGERLTVVVNHLKSKGSACTGAPLDDPDTGDGQGNCNLTRTAAAEALVDWLAADPTGSGDPDFLVMGDLNSYTFEDPITTFTDAGYRNLVRDSGGLGAYSYVFGGESGYLDHALASPSLAAQAIGAADWHINADEPIALDYNTEFKTANQVNTFYDNGPYRASDHDPVVINLALSTPSGFFLPKTVNPPAVNVVKAGDPFKLMFDLGGDQGLNVFAAGYPATAAHVCGAPGAIDATDPATPGKKGLTYDKKKGVYTFTWQTNKTWKNTCRTFVVKLTDGTYHYAEFRFK
jgi:uncharacterized protein